MLIGCWDQRVPEVFPIVSNIHLSSSPQSWRESEIEKTAWWHSKIYLLFLFGKTVLVIFRSHAHDRIGVFCSSSLVVPNKKEMLIEQMSKRNSTDDTDLASKQADWIDHLLTEDIETTHIIIVGFGFRSFLRFSCGRFGGGVLGGCARCWSSGCSKLRRIFQEFFQLEKKKTIQIAERKKRIHHLSVDSGQWLSNVPFSLARTRHQCLQQEPTNV